MIEQEQHKNNFTAEDIERYHSGKMTAQEMHSLEKAALDDPFLADALEGYIHTQTPATDIQFLRTELESRLGSNKVIALPKERDSKQFLKIAALLVLVAGLGWTVYQFSFKGNQEIAVTTAPIHEEATADTTDIAVTSTAIDSTPQLKEVDASNKLGSAANAPSAAKAETSYNEQLMVQNNRTGYAPANNNNGLTDNSTAARKLSKAQENNEAPTNTPFNADSASASSITMIPEARMPKDNVIVLQRAQDSTVQEVVLKNKSKKDSNYRKAQIIFEEAEPKDGQTYYDDYIAENLKVPENEKFKESSREIRLSFDVNDAGQAVNIQVEKSLCDECDKEAIRLLKEGPKLVKKQKSKKKGRISIRF